MLSDVEPQIGPFMPGDELEQVGAVIDRDAACDRHPVTDYCRAARHRGQGTGAHVSPLSMNQAVARRV